MYRAKNLSMVMDGKSLVYEVRSERGVAWAVATTREAAAEKATEMQAKYDTPLTAMRRGHRTIRKAV